MIERYLGMQEDPYVNIKFCVRCPVPNCGAINRKRGRKNLLSCEQCEALFCYICNKPQDSRAHYDFQTTCPEESDPYDDL